MRTFFRKIIFLFLMIWMYIVMWIFTNFQQLKFIAWKGISDKRRSTVDDNSHNFRGIFEKEDNFAKMKIDAEAAAAAAEASVQKITAETIKVNASNDGLFCTVQSDWNSRYISKTVESNLKLWTFKETQNCSSFRLGPLLNIEPKFTFSLNCEGKNVSVRERTIANKNFGNSDIFQVTFGDICLRAYINNCCKGTVPVPNVIHYVIYRKDRLTFYEFVSFISVIRFVRPCVILIHGDKLPAGDYWNYILTLSPNIVHVRRDPPRVISGQKIIYKEHASDVMRIEALILYGGIYLDTDTVIVKSLEPLRKYPCTMSLQSSGTLSSAFIMAEQNATFLQKWLDGYKYHYNGKSYIHNAMVYPKRIAREYKDLIHMEYGTLSRPWTKLSNMIYSTNRNWTYIYGIHLFSRSSEEHMNVELVKHFNSTAGSICRHVLFGNKELCFA